MCLTHLNTTHPHTHTHNRWLIRHSPTDYKTGKLYGQRPPMVIASFVYPELEAFINDFRCGILHNNIQESLALQAYVCCSFFAKPAAVV